MITSTMKRNRFIAFGLFVLSLFMGVSCNKLLDLKAIDEYTEGNFWNTKPQVEAYLTSIYGNVRGSYSTMRAFGELRAGMMKTTVSTTGENQYDVDLKLNLLDANRTGVTNWGGLYSSILRVNLFIKKVKEECPFLTDAERKTYLGRAHGVRAFYYFLLYRTYGGVVLETEPRVVTEAIDSPSKFYKERSTAKQTLDFIKSEVDQSESLLAGETLGSGPKIDWSLAATKMLKAEVYLWSAKVTTGDHTAGGEADFQVAKATLNQIINSGVYSLLPDFSKVFSTQNKNNAEVIYNLYFDREEATNDYVLYMYQKALFAGSAKDKNGTLLPGDPLDLRGEGRLFNEYKYSVVKAFDETDSRRSATFFEFFVGATAPYSPGAVMKKYMGQTYADGKHVFDSNILVYRYADALLMLAEVKNGLGEDPSTEINAVRKRAYGTHFAWHEYTHTTFAAAELAILQERTKEFVGEYKRWFDLIRLQDASKKSLVFSIEANFPDDPNQAHASTPILSTSETHKVLWPLDRTIINQDPKITQTPGYGS